MHNLDDSLFAYVRLTNNEQLSRLQYENNEPAHKTTPDIGESGMSLFESVSVRVDVCNVYASYVRVICNSL